MINSKHTPGPWWRDDDGFIAAGNGDEHKTIADCDCSDADIDEREANKALIAAAPEMLNALELAEISIRRLDRKNSAQGTLDVILAAIKKAKGESL